MLTSLPFSRKDVHMNHLCECFGHFIFEVTTILGVDLAEEVVMG